MSFEPFTVFNLKKSIFCCQYVFVVHCFRTNRCLVSWRIVLYENDNLSVALGFQIIIQYWLSPQSATERDEYDYRSVRVLCWEIFIIVIVISAVTRDTVPILLQLFFILLCRSAIVISSSEKFADR